MKSFSRALQLLLKKKENPFWLLAPGAAVSAVFGRHTRHPRARTRPRPGPVWVCVTVTVLPGLGE